MLGSSSASTRYKAASSREPRQRTRLIHRSYSSVASLACGGGSCPTAADSAPSAHDHRSLCRQQLGSISLLFLFFLKFHFHSHFHHLFILFYFRSRDLTRLFPAPVFAPAPQPMRVITCHSVRSIQSTASTSTGQQNGKDAVWDQDGRASTARQVSMVMDRFLVTALFLLYPPCTGQRLPGLPRHSTVIAL